MLVANQNKFGYKKSFFTNPKSIAAIVSSLPYQLQLLPNQQEDQSFLFWKGVDVV